MDKTAEQYALNVQTLRQFEATFANIKTEVKVPDPWADLPGALASMPPDQFGPGSVAKVIGYTWSTDGSNATVDVKLIVIGTPYGPVILFQAVQGSSSGKPSIEERTVIRYRIPESVYPLFKDRVSNPMRPEDLHFLIDPVDPERANLGTLLIALQSES